MKQESEEQQRILVHLGPTDDHDFWTLAIDTLLSDVETELRASSPKTTVYAQIGACSHWLRPHQTRWTKAGGFAWPSGYDGGRDSRLGLPEFDWSVLLHWSKDNQAWQCAKKFIGKRRLLLRAAFPTRTGHHHQAAVHTLWSPGSPTKPREKVRCFYGFRKLSGKWKAIAKEQLTL
ncbi:hypothetical protein C1752_00091 [Acaryochloris thomasi RCC1774]|uniref:Uncharacterized protein n=1 Tax=Acaryochloris thomasi RCC1774 TaxID=1764569 RepID=A0A2W1K1P1_9CYAN|nr:hypothetical protein [Acaryochloris thomasi]PZD75354.1 hypothetical protein C1752_00091 [Acaryochloris thomasi RCC1774]